MSEAVRQLVSSDPRLHRGYVHVYTGDGKGKTTAAIGLALRAAGTGLHTAIVAFMKNGDGGEFSLLKRFSDRIRIAYHGSGCLIHGIPVKNEVIRAQRGVTAIQQLINCRQYDLIILDEANMAAACRLITVDDLLALIRSKPPELELVLTGRYAHPDVIAAADLVTEMQEVKHYYREGVQARPGIDM